MSCNAAAQGSEKRRRSCPFGGGHARPAAGECGCECWWFLVQNCARLAAVKQMLSGGAVRVRGWSPGAARAARCPQRRIWAPGTHYLGPLTRPKKGRGVTPRRGSPTGTTHGVAAETAPLLPAPRACERAARLHALRRAAAAARVCPPQLGTTRHRLPAERDADDHGLGLLAAPSLRFSADERAATPTAPVAFRSRKCRVEAAPRRGRAQCCK